VKPTSLLLCLFFVTLGCDELPSGPTVALNERFTLAPGESARIDRSHVRLEFTDVTGDSRCPADAVCIQGGDAVVRVRATAGSAASTLELHTGDSTRAASTLQPNPFSSRTIAPGGYRATLRVTQ
jgi:hypothetical protein